MAKSTYYFALTAGTNDGFIFLWTTLSKFTLVISDFSFNPCKECILFIGSTHNSCKKPIKEEFKSFLDSSNGLGDSSEIKVSYIPHEPVILFRWEY